MHATSNLYNGIKYLNSLEGSAVDPDPYPDPD